MGKNKKDKKKKGLGAEKTLAKTEKKIQKNIKKELEEIGEDDIETLIAAFNEKEKELNQVKEELLPPGEFPSRRGGATLSLLPEKEELILFGGEYYDNQKVYVYNDLFIFSLRKNQWTKVKAPNAPPPRTFHQSVAISRNNGELWVFGGEFSSPSQSQFYHYNDMHVFNFQSKQWNKIVAPNAPSPRSGHRMALLKKYLIIFGGYYDNLRNCKFYNDTHLFNLETQQWNEMKFASNGLIDTPSPRSACHFLTCNKNNTIIVYGGFSKEKLKKEKEKGIVHSDMFVLSHELKKNDKVEWIWKRAKQLGAKPSERISSSMIAINDDTGILFGGVYDNQDDDNDLDDDDEYEAVGSLFYNDLYKLDLCTFKWSLVNLRGKRENKVKKPAKSTINESKDDGIDEEDEEQEQMDESVEEAIGDLSIDQSKAELDSKDKDENQVFKLTYSTQPTTSNNTETDITEAKVVIQNENIYKPSPRRSSYVQFYKGNLYLYGGKFEDKDDKEITYNDMHLLNVKKMDEWKVLFDDKDYLKSEEMKKTIESSDASDNEEDDDEDEDDESDMEIDAPEILPNESQIDYFNRTSEVWISEAQSEFPNEKSKKILNKMANELCAMFWKSVNQSKSSDG